MTKRVLWHSNAPWAPTGYGNQTGLFVPRLRQHYDLALSAFYGLDGAPQNVNGMVIFPAGRNGYGNDTLAADAQHYGADFVFSLMDVWVLNQQCTRQFRWIPWTPIDHDPVPPACVRALETAYRVVAMSKWGQRKLQEAGFEALYVPHAVETSVYKPLDRAKARARFNADDELFIVGGVMANKGAPSRKAFDQQIRAFGRFHKRHPKSLLYLHTEMNGTDGGENLWRLLELAGVNTDGFLFPDPYKYGRGFIGAQEMAEVYNAFDVCINATRGEGFGIPIIEAQACGTPVIATDFSAMPELVGAGWTVGYSDLFMYQDAYQVMPSVDEIEHALEEAFKRKGDAELRAQARAFALDYDADTVMDKYMLPVLREIERTIDGYKERREQVITIPARKEALHVAA